MHFVLSTVGLVLLHIAFGLHVAANVTTHFSELDEMGYNFDFGIWEVCFDWDYDNRDHHCRGLEDSRPDWLKTVQILLVLSAPLVLIAVILSMLQFVLACCMKIRSTSVLAVCWLIVALSGIGGGMITAAVIVYSVEYESSLHDILKAKLGITLPKREFVKDHTDLAWGFIIEAVAAGLFILGCLLHLGDAVIQCMRRKEFIQSTITETSNPTNQKVVYTTPPFSEQTKF